MQLAVLASHGGSNLQALIDAVADRRLPLEIALVLSNNAGAGALERAQNAGIPTRVINARSHPDAAMRDAAIRDALLEAGADYVQLAGYMKKLGPRTLAAFRGRILNIHPALLPKFGGRGMYGMRVHEAVLAAEERESGATLHVADSEYDTGPIVAQERVPVLDGDTPESLAARVLEAEHGLIVDTWRRIATGQVAISR